MGKKLSKLLSIIVLIVLNSCVKDLDFDQADDINFPIGVNVPLVKSKIKLSSYTETADKDILHIYPDGKMEIRYKQDSILKIDLNDITSINNQQLFSEDLIPNLPTLDIPVDLSNVNLVELTELALLKGKFKFKVVSTLPEITTISIKLKNGTIAGNPADFIFDASANSTTDTTFDITNFIIDLSKNGTTVNNLDFEISLTSNNAPLGTPVKVELFMEDVEIKNINGDFKNQFYSLITDSLNLPDFGLDNFTEGIHFNNPQIKLLVDNGIGINFGVDFNVTGIDKDSNFIDLGLNALNVLQATSPGTNNHQEFLIDKNTSSIVNFLGKVPSVIFFDGSLETNPSGGSHENFIDHTSNCVVGLSVHIPFEFYVDNVVFESEFDDVELVEESDVDINNAELFFETENTFPLDTDIKLYLLNENKTLLDSLELPILKASVVDANGETVSPTTHNFSLKLNKKQINSIYSTKHIQFKGKLKAGEGTNKVVVIKENYGVQIKMGIKIDGELLID